MKRAESICHIKEVFDNVIQYLMDTNKNEYCLSYHSEDEGIDTLKIQIKLM